MIPNREEIIKALKKSPSAKAFPMSHDYYDDLANSILEILAPTKRAISNIENAMERWHLVRDESDETIKKINDELVEIGLLTFFNNK